MFISNLVMDFENHSPEKRQNVALSQVCQVLSIDNLTMDNLEAAGENGKEMAGVIMRYSIWHRREQSPTFEDLTSAHELISKVATNAVTLVLLQNPEITPEVKIVTNIIFDVKYPSGNRTRLLIPLTEKRAIEIDVNDPIIQQIQGILNTEHANPALTTLPLQGGNIINMYKTSVPLENGETDDTVAAFDIAKDINYQILPFDLFEKLASATVKGLESTKGNNEEAKIEFKLRTGFTIGGVYAAYDHGNSTISANGIVSTNEGIDFDRMYEGIYTSKRQSEIKGEIEVDGEHDLVIALGGSKRVMELIMKDVRQEAQVPLSDGSTLPGVDGIIS